ncbi:MAG: DUF2332 family protein [Acidimicrobiia bacterium]
MTEPRDALAELFRFQGAACRDLGSSLWGAMCDRMADDVDHEGPTLDLLAAHVDSKIGDAYPLRVLGGAHRLALVGDAPELARHLPSTGGDGDADATWAALRALIDEPPPALTDALTRPPQTNEVGRSASLIGGFLVIAAETGLPVRVLEIGTSAGLNLRFDHFRYEQGDAGFGRVDSRVQFLGYWPSGIPPFDAPLTVASRRGCDVDPVDVSAPDGRTTLLSYVWPDQSERFERTAAAIAIAATVPAPIDRASAPGWLATQLAEPTAGHATVVFHSIMWQYLSGDLRHAVRDVLEHAGSAATERAPLAWLRLEPRRDLSYPELRLTIWPGGDERLLANCSFHLGPVEWVL